MVEPAGTPAQPGSSPSPAAPAAPAGGGTPAGAPAAPAPGPAPSAADAIPVAGDIAIVTPEPEAPPVPPGQTPPAPPATPGTPPTGDLAPHPGETAEAYAARLQASGVQIQRTADAQRALTAANMKAADLGKKLSTILGHPVVGPEAQRVVAPPGTPAPPARPAAPSALPTPHAPAQVPTGDGFEAAVKALYAEYSNTNLSEAEAFDKLVRGAVSLAEQRIVARLQSDQKLRQEFREDNYAYTTGRAREVAKAEAAGKEIETFWTEAAPHVPLDLLWSYAEQAGRAVPNDPPKQALFCLERALEAMEGVSAHLTHTQQTTDAMRRGQEAVLPAGGGAPPAPVTGKPPSMIDQMRTMRASQPGA